MDEYFVITLEFGANGETSEVNEYQEYTRATSEEAFAFYNQAIVDSESVGITGARIEFFDAAGFDEIETWGSYND